MMMHDFLTPALLLDLDDPAQRGAVLHDLLGCLERAAPTEEGAPALPLRLELDDPAVQAYARGWCDMLALLGALRWEGEQFAVVSPQAGYLLRELRALRGLHAPLVADWLAEGVRGGASAALETGVNLLAALEQRRLALDAGAPALRETRAALGLIMRRGAGGREALLVWDAAAGAWQLPGGRYEHRDGTLRATLLRELAEELECSALAENIDLQLAELGAPLERTRLSPTYGLRTRTLFQLFAVRWLAALPRLGGGARWLPERELFGGRTADGQVVAAEPLIELCGRPGADLDAALGL